ncbi:MAG: M28 family peptidase [Clostridiales bacterium]|jgi:acetylornithine deacetylase/succinyl-diaminopimelate desuccinylase-like protein|nr:M28 family peptidase [Clostridiales bacterium]
MGGIHVSQSTKDYMLDGIKHVCGAFKNRAPGTQSERDSQEYFKKELEKFSDEVIMEDFTVHPLAFMGFIPIAAFFFLVSIALYWLGPRSIWFSVAGVLLTFIAMAMFFMEFLLYRELVDFMFPKRVSRNVYAVRKPSGDVKRRIIFGGHADAAFEWTYSLHGQLKTLAPVIFGSILGMFFAAGANLSLMIKTLASGAPSIEGAWKAVGIILICFIPFGIAISFFINWRVIVDGANDNLSACYIAIGVLKEMSDDDFRYENTEVGCLITGSEESGLRGAKAFAKKHQKELKEVETVFIAMDTMREIEQLMVYTRGCTGTVHNCEAVGDLLRDAGLKAGVDMPRAGIYPGAVDAEAFTMHGIRAAGFCGVNHNPKTYYHTRHDTFENISPECIELSLKVCLEAAKLYDESGGIAVYEKARKNK